MSLCEYDGEWSVPPFGLRNGGVLCFFNTMVQILLSCPAFAIWLEGYLADVEAGTRKVQRREGPTIARLYLALLHDMRECYGGMRSGGIQVAEVYELFRYTAAASRHLIQTGRQEDLHEGLLAFLDSIDPEADTVFRLRHTCHIHCAGCRRTHATGGERDRQVNPCNIFLDVCGERFASQGEAEKYIKGFKLFPLDYRCENCGRKNTGEGEQPISQVFRLAQVSEVIILKLGDYEGKTERWFPETLRFRGRDGGHLNYRLVALVEHTGNRGGGHYYGYCLRPKPPGYHEARGERLAERLRVLGARETEERKRLEATIRENEEASPDAPAVFKLDDERAYYAPAGFRGDRYVLYAVYHYTGG